MLPGATVGLPTRIEGFEGARLGPSTWSVRADEQGILRGFTKDLSAPLNRDDAALLIYNALDVEMIQSYTTNNYPIVYSDHRTILSDKYGVIKEEPCSTEGQRQGLRLRCTSEHLTLDADNAVAGWKLAIKMVR